MAKFKQRSPIVDAIVWEGDNEKELRAHLPKGYPPPLFKDETVDLWTDRGIIRAHRGDFIVKEPDGMILVYRPEYFAGSYETIQETDKEGREAFAVAERRRAEIEKQRKEDGHGQD